MKYLNNIIISSLILGLTGCSGDSNNDLSTTEQQDSSTSEQQEIVSLETTVNTQLIIADNVSLAVLSALAYDQNNNFVYGVNPEFIVDGVVQSSNHFSTELDGEHLIYTQVGDVKSESITVVARQNRQHENISIPVIFHIVHSNEAVGTGNNLSQQAVENILAHLNKGFSNGYNSSNPNAIDMRISFRLAIYTQDDLLMDEPGINRIDGTPWDIGNGDEFDIANDKMFGLYEQTRLGGDTFWNPKEYKNVWVLPSAAGFSTADAYRTYNENDIIGIKAISAQHGVEPTKNNYDVNVLHTPYAAIAASHEMGHSFGLEHVFSNNGCQTSDYAPDTFSYNRSGGLRFDCDDNRGARTHDNIMDYEGTFQTFTYDQSERVRSMIAYGVWLDELIYSVK